MPSREVVETGKLKSAMRNGRRHTEVQINALLALFGALDVPFDCRCAQHACRRRGVVGASGGK